MPILWQLWHYLEVLMAVPDCKAIATILWTQTVHLQHQKLFTTCCPFADGRCSAGRHWGKSTPGSSFLHLGKVLLLWMTQSKSNYIDWLNLLVTNASTEWVRMGTLWVGQLDHGYCRCSSLRINMSFLSWISIFEIFLSFAHPWAIKITWEWCAHETFLESNFKCYHATKHLIFSFGISPCHCLVFSL